MQAQPDLWGHVRRYVQNHAVDDSSSPIHSPDRPDGVSELWFDTLDDLRAALATPGFRDVVAPDLERFLDLAATGSLVTREVPIVDDPPTAIKLCAAGYRKQGISREEAQRYWNQVHPGVVASVTEYARHVKRYVQNHPIAYEGRTIGRTLDHDLALELFFDSVDAMTGSFAEPEYLARVRPDELNFADVNDGLALVTRESVVYDR
jgi:hypothetical protein